MSPRLCRWTTGSFYDETGAYRDMVVNTSFPDSWRSWRWSPRPRLSHEPSVKKRTRCFVRSRTSTVAHVVEASMRDTSTTRRGARLGDRDIHRASLRDRQLAMGRGAVLSAHRQAHGRGRPDHLHRVPGTAQEHVPAELRRRRPRPRPPHVRPCRRIEALAVLLRQAPRARACGSTSRASSSRCTRPAGPPTCSRPTNG